MKSKSSLVKQLIKQCKELNVTINMFQFYGIKFLGDPIHLHIHKGIEDVAKILSVPVQSNHRYGKAQERCFEKFIVVDGIKVFEVEL